MKTNTGRTSPPVATRFQKGTSGNLKGRPRKGVPETSGSAFDILIDKTLTVTRHGLPYEATVEQALQHQTYKDAIAGKRSAIREVMKMIAKREEALVKRRKPNASPIKLLIEPIDPKNINVALLILGIVCRDERWGSSVPEERLLLEPWAVQSALGRRRGGRRLTDREVWDIKRCTRDAATLRWPRGTPG